MINLPTQLELQELQNFDELFCLTIYVPHIESNSAANNPNRIELKNLLREAETTLLSAGAVPSQVKKTLRPARQLIENNNFLPIHRESMAFFMHQKLFRYYLLPDIDIPYLLTVEKGFNLEPLSKVTKDNQTYFVLSLNHKNVRLFEGDHYQLRPVELDNFPNGLKEALSIDEFPKEAQTHSVAPSGGGKGSEAYHGQYSERETDKEMLLQFFRRIDKRLRAYLHNKRQPLLLAGVNYLLPIYRQVNSYPGLLPSAIYGNIEHSDLDSIRQKAWSIVKRSKA